MKTGILGTGIVAQTIADCLLANGHEVMLGSRQGNKSDLAVKKNLAQGSFTEAAMFGDILFNCTMGVHSTDAIKMAGPSNFKGKILVDVANPLDFSRGMPPRLTICNDNSLGEEMQRLLPECKIVKAFNTVSYELMGQPGKIKDGDFNLFICGEDPDAKATVTEIIIKEFNWKRESVIDLGGIVHARSTESLLLLLISLTMKYGSFSNGIRICRA